MSEVGLYCLTPAHVEALNVVAFSGKKNSGKSHMSRYVVENFGFMPEAQARHLKAEAIAFAGLPANEVWGSHKSPGTREWMENKGHGDRVLFGFDVWLKVTAANLYFAAESGVKNIVFSDIRYPNEVEWIQNVLGGKVYRIVGRGDMTSTAAPEIALDGYEGFAAVLDNAPGKEVEVMRHLRRRLAGDFGI